MSNYRASFLKTTALAIIVATLSLLLAIVVLSSLGQTFTARSFSLLLSASLSRFRFARCVVALGGIISLRRDALERAGRPYFSGRPRERFLPASRHAFGGGCRACCQARVLNWVCGQASGRGSGPSPKSPRRSTKMAASMDCRSCRKCSPIAARASRSSAE